MINPFDSEFLSQELRETWKKVEELEEENKELKEEIEGKDDLIKYLEGQIEQYQNNKEELEKENKELKEKIEWYEESMNKLVKNKQDLEKEIEELKENEVERLKKKCQEYEDKIEIEKLRLLNGFPTWPPVSVTTISEPYITNVTSISQEPEWIGYCSTGIPKNEQ